MFMPRAGGAALGASGGDSGADRNRVKTTAGKATLGGPVIRHEHGVRDAGAHRALEPIPHASAVSSAQPRPAHPPVTP